MFDSLLSIFIILGLQLLPIALIKKDWALILCLLLVNRKSTVLPDLSTTYISNTIYL
jgi:hypothetical protein